MLCGAVNAVKSGCPRSSLLFRWNVIERIWQNDAFFTSSFDIYDYFQALACTLSYLATFKKHLKIVCKHIADYVLHKKYVKDLQGKFIIKY